MSLPNQKPLFPLPLAVAEVAETLSIDEVRFDGAEYSPAADDVRLSGQILRVFRLMSDSRWRTLEEIARSTGDPHASISAQLRHLRKKRFGAHTVNRRARGDRQHGLYEYQLIVERRS
jgi:hypothetical protein